MGESVSHPVDVGDSDEEIRHSALHRAIDRGTLSHPTADPDEEDDRLSDDSSTKRQQSITPDLKKSDTHEDEPDREPETDKSNPSHSHSRGNGSSHPRRRHVQAYDDDDSDDAGDSPRTPSSLSPDSSDRDRPIRVKSLDDCEECLEDSQRRTSRLRKLALSLRKKIEEAKSRQETFDIPDKYVIAMSNSAGILKKTHKVLLRFFDASDRTHAYSGSSQELRYNALRKSFERIKQSAQAVLSSDEVRRVGLKAQMVRPQKTAIRQKIERSQKRGRRGHRSRNPDVDVNEEGAGAGAGGAGTDASSPGSPSSRKRRGRRGRRGRNTDDDQVQDQKQKQIQRMKLTITDEMTIDVEHQIAKETQQDLLAMDADMNEVLDITRDMSEMVDMQGMVIETIDNHVSGAQAKITAGRKNIHQARKHQRGGVLGLVTGRFRA